MSYSTSPAGINEAEKAGEAAIRDAKAGSPLGKSNTYNDAPNNAAPGLGTPAKNSINQLGGAKPAGSTSDTGRKQP